MYFEFPLLKEGEVLEGNHAFSMVSGTLVAGRMGWCGVNCGADGNELAEGQSLFV